MIIAVFVLLVLGVLGLVGTLFWQAHLASKRDLERTRRMWHPMPQTPRSEELTNLRAKQDELISERVWRERVAENKARREKKQPLPSVLRRQAD